MCLINVVHEHFNRRKENVKTSTCKYYGAMGPGGGGLTYRA